MKKLITIFLAIVLVMSMAACNNDTPSTETNPSVTTGNNETNVTEDTNESTSATEGTTTPDTTDPTQNAIEGTGPTDRDDNDETTTTTGNNSSETTTEPPKNATDVTEPTHTHNYIDKVTNPTCTKDGYTTHTCSCGNSYTDSKTDATGHSFGEWKTTKEPTTTTTGTSERKCSKCGATETKTLGKLAENHTHSYSSKVTKAATCKEEGVKTYSCSCGDSYNEPIAKIAHKYTDKVTKPTCTNGGYTTHSCSVCGYSYSDSYTNATGHSYKVTKTVSATCTEGGYTLYTCTPCGSSYKTNVTNKKGHSYSVTSDTATCTSSGTKTETCIGCGDKKTSASSAKGHGATRTETKDATTSAAGYTRVICTVCNGVVSETTIPKLEDTHNCSDYMKRINCKNLQDGAVGINTDKYRQYTSITILACSKCGEADTSSMQFAYSSAEASAIIVEMINQLRYEVYGTHAYDVQVATHHSAAEWAAEYITTDFYECTPFTENLAHINLNGNLIKRLFDAWKNSSGHYAAMINKDVKYISLAVHIGESTGAHGVLVMWDKNELYLDNPNYTWSCR